MSAGIASWEGRRVLVTGASSGIGAAIARDLAAAGAIVGMCARRTKDLDKVLADCRTHVPDCRAWTVDLTDLDAIDGFVQRVQDELGGIDVLINNAAQTYAADAVATPWSDIESLTRLNYLSPVRLTLAALPAMRARGSGHVVTISSMAARTSTPGEAAYAATKAALSTFLEALAGELWAEPVRFHLVYPALIDLTPGLDGDDELARSSNGALPIPAAVFARELRRWLATGELELYVPHTMKGYVAQRGHDVEAGVAFMGGLYATGALHPEPAR
jgi:short-subunit dehydrogenase